MPETVINIRAVDQASGAIRAAAGALGSIKNVVGGLALGAARVALENLGTAARAAWDALNEGAALELTERRFESLAANIGVTAAALDSQMAAASQGMMSHAERMATAGDIIQLGLADSSNEVTRLSVLMDQLGWSAAGLANTLEDDSTDGLNALGLSFDAVSAKMEVYEARGVAASEAFDLAVIEAGEDQLAALGDATETTAGKIAQLTSKWEDLSNGFKVGFAEGVADDLEIIIDTLDELDIKAEDVGSALGNRIGSAVSRQLGTAGMAVMIDDAENQLGELLGSQQAAEQAVARITEATNRAGIAQYGWRDGIFSTEVALKNQAAILEEVVALIDEMERVKMLSDPNAWANWAAGEQAAIALRDGVVGVGGAVDDTAVIMDGLPGATKEYAEAVLAAVEAGETMIVTEKGLVIATDQVSGHIRALAGLADVAAEAMARGADKAGVMAAAMRGLGDVAKENFLAQQAEAAEELAQFYDEVAGRMADSFTAALQPEGKMNFGNADAMAESAWSIAQAYDLTAVQIGNVGIALDEITPKQAEAAAKASIFQEAWGNLLGQFGAGNIDTAELMTAYDQLIADLESKSLIEIQVELGQVKNPPRDSWAWLPKEEREPIEIPVEFTPEQAALSSAIDLLDGIPANTEKLITFEAEYAEITDTAIPAIEAAITAIDATVLMAPETAELDAKIELINESRLTMYVDFVVGDTSAIPGRAAGGAVSGDSPYIIGEAGPELFVPWTNGTVVPNHRIAQSVGGGGGINMTMNFYGPATAADVRRAADDAGRRLLEQVRRAGVAV